MLDEFKNKGFIIVRKSIPTSVVEFLDRYLVMKESVAQQVIPREAGCDCKYWGQLTDALCETTWGNYGDVATEVLLEIQKPIIEEVLKIESPLIPHYSYTRVYKEGDALRAHLDREACEISSTINIGGDIWPIFIKDLSGSTHEASLSPGDMLVYQGVKLEHWREPFKGEHCSQVFLHYTTTNGLATGIKYDGRSQLGIPYKIGVLIKEEEEENNT